MAEDKPPSEKSPWNDGPKHRQARTRWQAIFGCLKSKCQACRRFDWLRQRRHPEAAFFPRADCEPQPSRRALPLSNRYSHCDHYLPFATDPAFEGSEAFVDRDQLNNSGPGIYEVLERRSNLGKSIENLILWAQA